MKGNFTRTMLAVASLLAIPATTIAKAIPATENSDSDINTNTNTNVARVTYNGDQVVYMQLPPNGELVYEQLAQVNIDNAMVHSDVSVRCFFWRQDRADTVQNWGNNYLSWSFSKVLRQPYSQAERLYCYDNTADKTDDGDDGKEGTFTLFIENRRGQKELVRVRVPGQAVYGELDLVVDGADADDADDGDANDGDNGDNVDPELRINVIRAALVDVPREEGVAGHVYERPPRCFIVSAAPNQATPTDLYHVALFHKSQPYLNVLGIVCFRAGYPEEALWQYSWRGSTG